MTETTRRQEPKPPRSVSCPTCGKPVAWVPESRFRPFCCERCRNIDLGAWANEEYKVAEPARQNGPGDLE
jgi:hypothetical protein